MKNLSFIRNGKEFEPTKDELKRVLDDYAERLAITEKALELACEELCDSDDISICNYCKHNIKSECPDKCPQGVVILEKYFQAKAKEKKNE